MLQTRKARNNKKKSSEKKHLAEHFLGSNVSKHNCIEPLPVIHMQTLQEK